MRVLVVDDVAANRLVLTCLLKRLGCETHSAADADEARSIAAEWHPACVLTDLHLGKGETGLSLAESLRTAPGGEGLRIGLMTGDAVEACDGKGVCDAVLEKPIAAKELITFLQLEGDLS